MIALRANDGSSPAQFKIPGPVFQANGRPRELSKNEWNRGRSLLSMGNVTPFGIPSVSEFLLDPPPALESNQYAKAYNEVKAVGSIDSKERSQDRADVVHFYAASSPTFIFNLAARQVVAQEGGRSLSENARSFALINMAIGDGSFRFLLNKYHYNFWRPETPIHAGDTDGNRKPTLIRNGPISSRPMFPGLSLNHGTYPMRKPRVLRRLYGEAGHAITLVKPGSTNIVLHYGSFRQIYRRHLRRSRLRRVHFRTDQDAGARLGRAVGTTVYKNNLRAKHGNDRDDD